MGATRIDWCDYVWNPVTGCSKVSEGCRNCYAESIARRFWGERKFTDVQCHERKLHDPLSWKKPRRVFVNSMSDLFHHDVPDGFIFGVFMRMAKASQHTFIILTKRPQRMLEWLWSHEGFHNLPNVWMGVSVEDQQTADERIPLLLAAPAAVRFVSCEPLLGPVDLGMSIATCKCCLPRWSSRWVQLHRTVRADFHFPGQIRCFAKPNIYRAVSNPHGALSVNTPGGLLGIKPSEFECLPKLDWVICGGESGPHARPVDPAWVKSLRDQCQLASIPFFFKQWGPNKKAGCLLDGVEYKELPDGR